jgi:hypothetical protein
MKIKEAGVPGQANTASAAPLERITVNLTPRAAQALAASIARTGDSKTDTVIRAITVYDFLGSLQDEGHVLYLRTNGSKELERLRIL